MTELENVLRESFARLSEPGDPAGVAKAIQLRVDAGDTGTPGDGSGFGGGGGMRPWLPWVGLALVAALVGGATGASGLVGSRQAAQPAVAASINSGVSALDCPAGAPVAKLDPGDRVLALLRSEDSKYLQVRNPYNVNQLVWLPTGVVVVDKNQRAVSTLAVGGCPKPAIALDATSAPAPADTSVPAPTQGSSQAPGPPPVPDTTKPTISAGLFSPNPVYGTAANLNPSGCPTSTTVKITATDNVGVTGVTGATAGGPSGAQITLVSHSGSSYVFKYQIDYNGANAGAIISFTAKDAAGNQAIAYAGLKVYSGHSSGCWLG